MTHTRRPISLVMSVALGIGAALVVLLAGGRTAAAAPAHSAANLLLPANCYARNDSATGTIYSSTTSAAVRQAVAAAVPNDLIRLAGTCAGVAAQLGTTQTVVITQPLTLEGGYSIADWADSFPITQPTTLDAQSQGRVITASANFTISALTVQHGYSGGGNGGGIFAGNGLTAINPVNILSNTTLLTPTLAGAMSPAYMPNESARHGGGIHGEGNQPISFVDRQLTIPRSVLAGNGADYGAGIDGYNVNLVHVTFRSNSATLFGGGLFVLNNLIANNVAFIENHTDHFGGGFDVNGPATFTNLDCHDNTAGGGGCGASAGFLLTINECTMSGDTAIDGGGLDIFDAITQISRCLMTNELATGAGGVVYDTDAPLFMVNNVYIADTAPQGSVLFAERFLASYDILYVDEFGTDSFTVPVPHASTNATRNVNPLVSSTAPTRSAYFASGVTIFVTGTIIAGYALDFETGTAPSSTIHADYNLFDHTPVISGTNITTGTHSLVGNPLFADALGHLSAGSPAIDHGIDVGINTDLDGNHRPSGAGFDIGAYEFQLAKLFLPLVRR